jgi:hypothetical protein
MFIKRNLRSNGSTDITRRGVITGIAAGLTGVMLESSLLGQRQPPTVDQHKVVVAVPLTQLYMADMYGNKSGSSLGFVIACPQSCAAARPGYAQARTTQSLNAVYLNTSEWMREIIYTADDLSLGTSQQKIADKTWSSYRRQLGFHRVSNDAYAAGCGHISRNVLITKVSTQSGKFTESPLGSAYSSVVFDGIPDSNGPLYQATNIYIYQGDWAPLDAVKTPVLNKVVAEIGTDDRPLDVSACPASNLPYPQ